MIQWFSIASKITKKRLSGIYNKKLYDVCLAHDKLWITYSFHKSNVKPHQILIITAVPWSGLIKTAIANNFLFSTPILNDLFLLRYKKVISNKDTYLTFIQTSPVYENIYDDQPLSYIQGVSTMVDRIYLIISKSTTPEHLSKIQEVLPVNVLINIFVHGDYDDSMINYIKSSNEIFKHNKINNDIITSPDDYFSKMKNLEKWQN